MRRLLLVILTFLVYSLSGVFSKYASMHEALSVECIGFFAAVILVLGVYAVLWQKLLALMPLGKAFQYKSITLLFGLLLAHIVFGEDITRNNIIGAAIIFSGLLVLTSKEENKA